MGHRSRRRSKLGGGGGLALRAGLRPPTASITENHPGGQRRALPSRGRPEGRHNRGRLTVRPRRRGCEFARAADGFVRDRWRKSSAIAIAAPKLIVNSTGDQYFLPDSPQFYFEGLRGEKYLRYVPNTDHSLRGSYQDAAESALAFYQSILTNTPRPRFAWTAPPASSAVARPSPARDRRTARPPWCWAAEMTPVAIGCCKAAPRQTLPHHRSHCSRVRRAAGRDLAREFRHHRLSAARQWTALTRP